MVALEGIVTFMLSVITAVFAGVAAVIAVWGRVHRVSLSFKPGYNRHANDSLDWKDLWTITSKNMRPVRIEEVGVVFPGRPWKVCVETKSGGRRLPLTVEDEHLIELSSSRRMIVEGATRLGQTHGQMSFRPYAEKASGIKKRCLGGRWTLDLDRNNAIEPQPGAVFRLRDRLRRTLQRR